MDNSERAGEEVMFGGYNQRQETLVAHDHGTFLGSCARGNDCGHEACALGRKRDGDVNVPTLKIISLYGKKKSHTKSSSFLMVCVKPRQH
jgi:hypothetical protein